MSRSLTFASSVLAPWILTAGALTAPPTQAEPVYEVVHSFLQPDGCTPRGPLVLAQDGNFYGIDTQGGPRKQGAVFRMTPEGVVTAVHFFVRSEGLDPNHGLAPGPDGWLYGTTFRAGPSIAGSLFRVSIHGKFEVLHAFTLHEGNGPLAPPVVAPTGEVYGTTNYGGPDGHGEGTVYRWTAETGLALLHSFDDTGSSGYTGYWPRGLTLGPDGMLYGVNAASLPSATCQYGCGGIFRLSPDGLRFRARLLRKSEGDDPWTAPSFGSDGMLYGSAEYGGLVNQCGGAGCGTIWRASPDTLVIEAVHRLREHEGSQPKSIMMARDGNLYGVAQHGAGTAACPDCGSVFRISAGGKLDVLHVFGGVDGANPDSTLVETDDGSLWGTAAEGGAHRVGAAFRLSGY